MESYPTKSAASTSPGSTRAAIHSYGWDYGRLVPSVGDGQHDSADRPNAPHDWVDYDAIYIVDLSVDELMGRDDLRDKIIWIDHHQSSMRRYDCEAIDR